MNSMEKIQISVIQDSDAVDTLPNLVIEKQIGSGNFGVVYLGNCDGTPW